MEKGEKLNKKIFHRLPSEKVIFLIAQEGEYNLLTRGFDNGEGFPFV